MLKLLGFLIKLATFSLVVLVIGNWVHWRGRTISDQVRTGLSQAERSEVVENIRGWAKSVTQDLNGNQKKTKVRPNPAAGSQKNSENEKLPPSERQKLRALIQELNTAQNGN